MKLSRLFTCAVSSLLIPVGASAAVPKVVADIAPIQSLVSQVMTGVGSPELLVQSGASPHTYSLSPSEAESLQQADVVFWVGEPLTPWLEGSLENLSGDADVVELLEVPGTTTYAFRKGATFESHEHHGEHEGEEHHDDEQHDDEHQGEEHHHHHDGLDPHAWLDPVNGRVWLDAIAGALSQEDPEHAAVYARNAEAGKKKIDAVMADVQATIDELGAQQFIVFHDAYQYFEKRFGIAAAGAISIGDASKPSPARIDEIRGLVSDLKVSCVFTEPQYNPGIVRSVFGDTGVKTSAVIDPLGSDLTAGADLYPELLTSIAGSLRSCFGGGA
ncbi:zinc ABC transporter substrate-binding protein [Marinobacter sp. JSM 1782161]|uniref:zinc ABC transporter substrate-binding protein n=1 Tax=Marinobacter sp. JSM 1782161 TaxID=2685906 RepID=UPI001D196E72|nr:zinc ABC transporter substrate-binding protein [Marinobacter sp. JSM 1782161]